MHKSDTDTLAHDDDKFDQAILSLLVHERSRGPWAVEELVREIGDRIAVEDALARLYGAGLIHRLEAGFVFATRAALRADQLAA
jgi:DNA-binding transcriptional ArsR family regulator